MRTSGILMESSSLIAVFTRPVQNRASKGAVEVIYQAHSGSMGAWMPLDGQSVTQSVTLLEF